MSESIQRAVEAIRLADAESTNDLDLIVQEVRSLQRRYETQKQRQFRPGDRVTFEGKGGQTVTGTVEKILQKNIKVQADNGMPWRVSPSLLSRE